MLVYPIQVLGADRQLWLADFIISQRFYAVFNRYERKALVMIERSTKLEFDGKFFYLLTRDGFIIFMSPFAGEIITNIYKQIYQQNYSFYYQVDNEDSDGLFHSMRGQPAVCNQKIELIDGFLHVNGRRAASYKAEPDASSCAMHALVCGANWYHEHMQEFMAALGDVEFLQPYRDDVPISRQLYAKKAVYHLDAAKTHEFTQSSAFTVYSIVIYTMKYGLQRFDVSKGVLAFAQCPDHKQRGEKRSKTPKTHVSIVLKHGMTRYAIDSISNVAQDDWIVRLLDPANVAVQNMLEKVKLKETAAAVRDTLQRRTNEFKNQVRRELDSKQNVLRAGYEAGTIKFASSADLQRYQDALSRCAANESQFSVRDDYRLASKYDCLGIFVCGQSQPIPARVIVFSGRHYYNILQIVMQICSVGK